MVLKNLELPASHDLLDQFIRDVRDSDTTARWNAVRGIGRLEPSSAVAFVPSLVEALGDRSIVVRVSAAEALGRIDPENTEVVTALMSALRDKYATVREAASMAIGNAGRGGLPAVDGLREALRDESEYVRKEAANALGRIASSFSDEYLPILLAELLDPSPSRRARSAFLLGEMGDGGRPALGYLKRIGNDPNPEVRRTVTEAIRKLDSGRDPTPSTVVSKASVDRELPAPGSTAGIHTESGWRGAPGSSEVFAWPPPGTDDGASIPTLPARQVSDLDPTQPGSVQDPEAVRWLIPNSLRCGSLGRGLRYERILRIGVPVPCRLTSDSELVVLDREQLARGPRQILLTIGPMPEEGPFQSSLKLITPSFERRIEISFEVIPTTSLGTAPAPQRAILWQPSHWTKLLATAASRADAYGNSTDGASSSTDRESSDHHFGPGSSKLASPPSKLDARYPALVDADRASTSDFPTPSLPYTAYRITPRLVGPSPRRQFPWLVVIVMGLILTAAIGFRSLTIPGTAKPPRSPNSPTSPATLRPEAAPVPSDTSPAFVAQSVKMPFSLIIPKDFMMGQWESNDDQDDPDGADKKISAGGPNKKIGLAHLVSLTREYYIGEYEVTREQWNRVMPLPLQKPGEAEADRPVDVVSWFDAVRFCNALSVLEKSAPYYKIRNDDLVAIEDPSGSGYRLPTEAEWEYACRAGSTTRWFFGDSPRDLGSYAFFASNSEERSHPVGKKLPNPFGLYDTYGNVAEWCWDWYDDYQTATENPSGPSAPRGPKATWSRVLRGGDWGNYESDIDSFNRSFAKPQSRNLSYGFRVARNLTPDERNRVPRP
jgi:formylglycine-generating enzyme required for sulfatase activity